VERMPVNGARQGEANFQCAMYGIRQEINVLIVFGARLPVER
jgi:hypothetical protein